MSDELKITALEGALRDATRLRIEAEVKLQVFKAEQEDALENLRRTRSIARMAVELWYACRKDSTQKLSETPLGRDFNHSLGYVISNAEDDLLESVGVKVDRYSQQRVIEEHISSWKAVTQ